MLLETSLPLLKCFPTLTWAVMLKLDLNEL